jgi:serine/threonine protein kinase
VDILHRLTVSYYKTVTPISEDHKVYLVRHEQTGAICIKKILNVYRTDVYARLMEHPISGTPRIIDYYESDNTLTVIEEYIQGQSLDKVIQAGNLSSSFLFKTLLELCSILNDLHTMEPPIIHRDIKPSNIILSEEGHVTLLDFNAAKTFDPSESRDTVLIGTEGYAAPEQYGFGASSPKTDIYSVGVLIQEMLSSCAEEDRNLARIADRCMNLDPSNRYASVTELQKDLESAACGKQAISSKRKYLPPGFRTGKPWKMILALIGYLFLTLISLATTVENATGIKLAYYRIDMFLTGLITIAVWTDYGNIQMLMPLCRQKNLIIKLFGILLLNALLLLAEMILFLLVGALFFST